MASSNKEKSVGVSPRNRRINVNRRCPEGAADRKDGFERRFEVIAQDSDRADVLSISSVYFICINGELIIPMFLISNILYVIIITVLANL